MPGHEWMDKKISEYTEKMAGTFLFFLDKNKESNALDMRTRVLNLDLMRALTYYGTMKNAYGVASADDAKQLIERLLIAYEGKGREEAVDTLRQQFAKKVEVETGREKGLED